MGSSRLPQFDEIGYWSEIKLDIVKKYAGAYSTILSAQRAPRFSHVYIDAFAGRGVHLSKRTGAFVLGSPLNALLVEPPFQEYFFIDLDGDKVQALKKLTSGRADVHILEGDCNQLLLDKVFPKVRYQDYRRGLCLLDPYGLDLDWKIIETAGRMQSIDIFLNFPVMDMNRNALWRNPDKVGEVGIGKMNRFWGDETWRKAVYRKAKTLFGSEDEKVGNDLVVEAFGERLKKVGGFKNVSEPMPMRNSKGAIVYYLLLASQKLVAKEIVDEIIKKYSERGGV